MNLDDLLTQTCPWLLDDGKDNDIAISCRIRLARNLIGFPFPSHATELDRRLICESIRQAVEELFSSDENFFVCMSALSHLDRELLRERQLISRELVEGNKTQAALLDPLERYCVMINEEDHLRIHAARSGFEPQKIWEQVDQIDNLFARKLDYVFHEKYGFLTSSVANVGTGMKISVMLHLPALIATHELDKVFRSLQKAHLAICGLYGEGTQPLGDFFQIYNRTTLGKSEEEFIVKMINLIPQVVDFEQQARNFLLKNRRAILLDRCNRDVDVLRTARKVNQAEAMYLLSSLRLGSSLGLLEGVSRTTINALLLNTQPAHLQKMQGEHAVQADQDVIRATYLRESLGKLLLNNH